MQRDIETLDAAPPSLPQLRGEEDSVRTHALVCPVRICGGHMLRPPGGDASICRLHPSAHISGG